MAPSKSIKLQKSNGSVEASSSSSRKQEKSSIEKITKNPIKYQTTKNALNLKSVEKLQDLLYEDIGTNSQESGFHNPMRFRCKTMTVNLEQLRANLVSTMC